MSYNLFAAQQIYINNFKYFKCIYIYVFKYKILNNKYDEYMIISAHTLIIIISVK